MASFMYTTEAVGKAYNQNCIDVLALFPRGVSRFGNPRKYERDAESLGGDSARHKSHQSRLSI